MIDLATKLARIGTEPDPETGALTPPIHMASTYARDEAGEYSRGFVYSRLENPTRRRFEEALADIEGGESCAAFSSGMASAMTLFQALDPGDHIVFPADIYFGVRHLATTVFSRWGLKSDIVDMSRLDSVQDAITDRTRIVWAESPSNPQLNITDIEGVAEIAHAASAQLVVDSTWSTPYLMQPIALGADIVLHSVTKYLGGHSDVLGGALVFSEKTTLSERVHELQREAGAVLDPFSCWLTMRGMRSLIPRMNRHCASAAHLASFLEGHPHVDTVLYPGLSSHEGHDIARRQMRDFGGMLAFLVNGNAEQAQHVCRELELFASATSLGGTESLIEHRASVEGPDSPTPESLLRVSVGLESPSDLEADLNRALEIVFN